MVFNSEKPFNDLLYLPPKFELETKAVLKQAVKSSRALAELKLAGRALPKQEVLINSLVLLEAKDSSEIENIFTTHDKLYQTDMFDASDADSHTKEVKNYREALWNGAMAMTKKPLNTNVFVEIVQTIKKNDKGIRKTSGTQIVNPLGEVIYTPPEGEQLLRDLLQNLEQFIHDTEDFDPLIKMAVIHYQFEAIHPFYDGNGRAGRILNILYLLQERLLETPVLFLSRYIIENKTAYYKGLQNVTENQSWEDWILYTLKAVEDTALRTVKKIDSIQETMVYFSDQLKKKDSKLYSKELVEYLFEQPYARITALADRLDITRQTASNRLKKLEYYNLLTSVRAQNEIIYLNPYFIDELSKDS